MNTILIIVGLYVVWTVIGIMFFLRIMRQKIRKARWYDCLLLLPIALIIGLIGLWNKND